MQNLITDSVSFVLATICIGLAGDVQAGGSQPVAQPLAVAQVAADSSKPASELETPEAAQFVELEKLVSPWQRQTLRSGSRPFRSSRNCRRTRCLCWVNMPVVVAMRKSPVGLFSCWRHFLPPVTMSVVKPQAKLLNEHRSASAGWLLKRHQKFLIETGNVGCC